MSDQEDDKKISNDEVNSSENENQSPVDQKNQPEDVKIENEATSAQENPENQTPAVENQNNEPNEDVGASNNDQTADNLETSDTSNEKKDENVGSSHQVIHKKDGRLHIYVRQDKYKGELKSKNWVGRLYIDGKQKISSSGTTNLEEAIPILEKWFDDVHEESEKLKKQTEEVKNTENQSQPETVQSQTSVEEVTNLVSSVSTEPNQTNEVAPQAQTTSTPLDEKVEPTQTDEAKGKLANIFGKLKDIKLKKPSFANNLTKSSLTSFNKGNIGGLKSKFESFFKSKLGKSTAKGEEILGVQLFNNEIRLVQVSSNKANQWVLEKFYIHPVEITDDSSPIDNADKFSEELSLAIQKSKITTANAAIAIPVTSAIIRVVTAPLMKDEELEKAIETNSLWENLVQLTDNLEDYSIFHQVISRNQKDNTMDILFVASKLSDINSYTSIIKNAGLNPVIIDVKCFALKSAVDQVNQLTNKTEDANLTAVLEFGLDENYLMILYDNNPIITDIFIRGQDRKILQGSQDAEEKEALVRRYVTQVKQAIQDFETKYEKRIRNIKVVSDIENVDEYLGSFRKFLLNVGFNTLDPTEGLKIPTQFQAIIDQKQNKSFLTTAIGLAFRKLDVFGYYKFVTAVKNINLLPDRSSMMKQKKMKAISGFAFKGVVGLVAGIYLILFGMSFWNIYSYNKKLTDYEKVKVEHSKSVKQKKVVRKELGRIETSLKLSRTLKSNKDLTYRALAQIASSVPKRVRFDKVDFDGKNRITIQGVAATDQDILKFIDNLGKQKLVSQASLSSMRLPKRSRGGASMKGFRVFVTLKKG